MSNKINNPEPRAITIRTIKKKEVACKHVIFIKDENNKLTPGTCGESIPQGTMLLWTSDTIPLGWEEITLSMVMPAHIPPLSLEDVFKDKEDITIKQDSKTTK